MGAISCHVLLRLRASSEKHPLGLGKEPAVIFLMREAAVEGSAETRLPWVRVGGVWMCDGKGRKG